MYPAVQVEVQLGAATPCRRLFSPGEVLAVPLGAGNDADPGALQTGGLVGASAFTNPPCSASTRADGFLGTGRCWPDIRVGGERPRSVRNRRPCAGRSRPVPGSLSADVAEAFRGRKLCSHTMEALCSDGTVDEAIQQGQLLHDGCRRLHPMPGTGLRPQLYLTADHLDTRWNPLHERSRWPAELACWKSACRFSLQPARTSCPLTPTGRRFSGDHWVNTGMPQAGCAGSAVACPIEGDAIRPNSSNWRYWIPAG